MQEDPAVEEASEVLHTRLTKEEIEELEIIVDGNDNQSSSSRPLHKNAATTNVANAETTIQYAPVSVSHSIFSSIDGANHYSSSMDDQQVVIWEGTIVEDPTDSNMQPIYPVDEPEETPVVILRASKTTPKDKSQVPSTYAKKKVLPTKRKRKTPLPSSNEPTKLEESPAQVKDHFKRGCECQDESCFRGLDAEKVFKHRHDIAELTKGEHDMYLMGVTMASLANPTTTVRDKERRRLRARYVFQGRRVCLDAFLYLENCTHYQLKNIRKHVMTHGVAPRVHGNHGRRPHNTLSLDIYCHAREFLKQYLEQHTGGTDILDIKQAVQLPWDVTRKKLHDAYKNYCNILELGIKVMGYSTFRHFMKEQFPHVKFFKLEPKGNNHCNQHQQQQKQQQKQQSQQEQQQPQLQQITVQHTQEQAQIQQSTQHIQTLERPRDQTVQQAQKFILNNEIQQVIPLVVASNESGGNQHQQSQAFLVTSVPQIISNANIVPQQNNGTHNSNTFSYQLTNTGYAMNQQGNIVTTMANVQHHARYYGGM
ncbi:unnamed protein product [Ceutorhynchus assimilis]|uniref:Uncharacterized protein n=1 Tax=Ceutorhynchus assimilis TaxID=467358 RepID=A0A9N9MU25_9CUCU|nr:unnamed protein product [Ceutorhynchus assimilis]